MAGSLGSLLKELSKHEIQYMVVGGMAGVLHGAPVVTADLDIVHKRSEANVARLLELLSELKATFRTDSRGLKPQESHLMGRGHARQRPASGES